MKDYCFIFVLEGVIYVTGPLDRETQSVIEFDIFAYSSDKYSDRITSHVKISLTDVNDVAPIFSKVRHRLSVFDLWD